jgi:hypothetical protein
MASPNSGYSLYTMAYFIQNGMGNQYQNLTKAVELYDLLIERANNDWYTYEEMYPALLQKWYLRFKLLILNYIPTWVIDLKN